MTLKQVSVIIEFVKINRFLLLKVKSEKTTRLFGLRVDHDGGSDRGDGVAGEDNDNDMP